MEYFRVTEFLTEANLLELRYEIFKNTEGGYSSILSYKLVVHWLEKHPKITKQLTRRNLNATFFAYAVLFYLELSETTPEN